MSSNSFIFVRLLHNPPHRRFVVKHRNGYIWSGTSFYALQQNTLVQGIQLVEKFYLNNKRHHHFPPRLILVSLHNLGIVLPTMPLLDQIKPWDSLSSSGLEVEFYFDKRCLSVLILPALFLCCSCGPTWHNKSLSAWTCG